MTKTEIDNILSEALNKIERMIKNAKLEHMHMIHGYVDRAIKFANRNLTYTENMVFTDGLLEIFREEK